MTTDHVHARPLERFVAHKLSTTRNWFLTKLRFTMNRHISMAITVLMWTAVLGLTLALGLYLKLPGTILLILMFISLVMHEQGHYYEMLRAGVPVEEVGVGVPFGLFRRVQYRVRTTRLPFRLMLSPLWIAFYVDEGESGKPVLDSLDYKTRVRIFAAGPTVNLVLFIVLIAALPMHAVLSGNFTPELLSLLSTFAAAITAWLIFKWWFPRGAHILSPLMGVAIVVLLVSSVWGAMLSDPVQAISNGGSLEGEPKAVLGPITMIQMMARGDDPFGGQLGNSRLLIMHGFIAVLNFGLAATNFLPIKWFDGGQIWGAILDEKVGKRRSAIILNWTTLIVFSPLVIVLAFSEFSGLWSWLLLGILLLLVLAHVAEKRLGTVNECVQTCTT